MVVEFGGGVSNHCYSMITSGDKPNFGPKPFNFFRFWADNENFLDWVREACNGVYHGSAMFILCNKLKAVKATLKKINGNQFNCLSQRVVKARLELEQVQSQLLSFPSVELVSKERECLHHYLSLVTFQRPWSWSRCKVSFFPPLVLS